MDFQKYSINLRIRRFDLSDDPEIISKVIKVSPNIEYNNLKQELQNVCEISLDNKVMKIRNTRQALVPLSFLTDTKENFFYVDISNITYVDNSSPSLLQDAYVDAVRQKVQNLESRITETELLLPQLEWRRQAYMEETVVGLTGKVSFLNRRFDELLPQLQSKVAETAG